MLLQTTTAIKDPKVYLWLIVFVAIIFFGGRFLIKDIHNFKPYHYIAQARIFVLLGVVLLCAYGLIVLILRLIG